MSQTPAPQDDDLREGWPEDAGNDELAQFARELVARRPALPEEAMARVKAAMEGELAQAERRDKQRVFVGRLAMAAGVLLGLGLCAHFAMKSPPGGGGVMPSPVVVRDTYMVKVGGGAAAVEGSGRLVRVEEYRSLTGG